MPTNSACAPANHATYYRCILSNRPHSLQKGRSPRCDFAIPERPGNLRPGPVSGPLYFVISGAARRCVFRPDGGAKSSIYCLFGRLSSVSRPLRSTTSAPRRSERRLWSPPIRVGALRVAAESDSDLARQIYRTALEVDFTHTILSSSLSVASPRPRESRFVHP